MAEEMGSETPFLEQDVKLLLENLHICWIFTGCNHWGDASKLPDDNTLIGWRQSRDWHSELRSPDETFKVVLPLGVIEKEGSEGMDSHLWEEVPLGRMCLSCRGLTALSQRRVLLTGLGNMAHALQEDLAPFEACFLFSGEENPHPLKGRFLMSMWCQGLGQCCVVAAMALILFLEGKFLSRILELSDHLLSLTVENPTTHKGGKAQRQLLIYEARIHQVKDADPVPKSGSRHEADKASSYYDVKVSNNLTTDSSEVRKDEGEVEASSAIMEAKNLELTYSKRGRLWPCTDPSPVQGVEPQ